MLGVDVGNSSCKPTLISPNGEAFATSSDHYPLVTPQPDWAEQDPTRWRRGMAESIASVLGAAGATSGQVAALGLSGQMRSAV